ncbi:MAG: efflux RND transporter periplasmic adaptor subunit [Armatimonadota bacterium]
MKKYSSMWAISIVALSIIGCGKRDEAVVEVPLTVAKGDVGITIIENGTVDSVKTVEIKPQVSGRLIRLLVDEGSVVKAGDLVAIIDPKPTQLQLDSSRAQLIGAQSSVDRTSIEISQRITTSRAAVVNAEARVRQLELDLRSAPALLQSEINQAKANLASVVQDRDRFLSNSQPTQRASAKANLDEADQNLKNAQIDLKRQQELEDKGYVATKAVESASLAVELAKARYYSAKTANDRIEAGFTSELARAEESIKNAKAALSRANTNLYTLENKRQDLRSAKADLEKARAGLADPSALEKSKLQSKASVMQIQASLQENERLLRETNVYSQISGIVTKRLLQVGENATGLGQFSSGTTIVRIEDRTQMRVKLAVNEIDVARLSIGMDAEVNVDAVPNKTLKGRVSKIAPAKQVAEGQTALVGSDSVVKYEVEIMLAEVDPGLKSGMSAKCTMRVANKKDVVFLPAEYTEKKGNDYFAYIPAANPKDPKSKPTSVPIKVGLVTSSKIEILSGLKAGDKVVKPEFNGPSRKGFMQMGRDDDSSGSNNAEAKKDDGAKK